MLTANPTHPSLQRGAQTKKTMDMKARLSIRNSQPLAISEALNLQLTHEQKKCYRPVTDAERKARAQALKDMGLN